MPASGKINVEPLADFSNIARQTDLSALPESEWLGRCLERNNELPIEQAGMEQQLDDLWFEVLPRSEEDWLNQPLERDIELPVGQPYERPLTKLFAEGTSQSVPLWIEHGFEINTELPTGAPVSKNVLQKLFSKISTPPDISKGLGKHQEKRDISQLEQFVANNLPLMMYEEELYLYEPPYWRKINEREAKKEIRAFLEKKCKIDFLTESEYRKILDLLIINPDISEERKFTSPNGKVNMLDGTYDLQTGELLPHDAEDYFFTCINVHGREMDTCRGDTFEAFVQNCSDGDPMVRKQLLQLVALTLLGKPLKHFFVLLGESNTGKTQFGRFLEELVGRNNVESVRGTNDFGDRWTVGTLAGKLLGVCLDLPNGPLPASAIGAIKQMVGDDPIKVEKKHRSPSTCYDKPLLLFAGNHPIQIPHIEEEQALLNRMIVIPFRNPVQEADMKQELYKDLLEEAPYIVREALAEYRELERNNFQLARSELPPELMPYDSRAGHRSVGRFLDQECELDKDAETPTSDLYRAYCAFALDDGIELSSINFSRQLSDHLKRHSKVTSVKRASGTDSRGYRGIRLKQDRPEDIGPLS